MSVVELEPVPGRAASTPLVDVAAAIAVALPHRTADGGGNVAHAGDMSVSPSRLRERGSGRSAGFEPFELLGDRRSMIAPGSPSDLRAQQVSGRPLAQLGTGVNCTL
jgi:hypothetical protein